MSLALTREQDWCGLGQRAGGRGDTKTKISGLVYHTFILFYFYEKEARSTGHCCYSTSWGL